MSGRAAQQRPRPWPNQHALEDTMQTSSAPRLKKFGDTLALKWDGSVDCAYDVFDFLREVDGGIDNNSVVIFRNEDGQYVEAEPDQWIVKRSRYHFDVLTGKALLAALQGDRA